MVFRKSDVRPTVLYALSALAVRLVPQARWGAAVRWLDRVGRGSAAQAQQYRQYRDGFRGVIGSHVPEDQIRALFELAVSHRRRTSLLVAASRCRRGWKPDIDLVGVEKLEQASRRGRGVILWFDNFALSSIVGKRAIAEAGHRMWYLSDESHGYGNSAYCKRFLNTRVVEVENRYLAGRIVVSKDSVVAATRRIIEILDGNGLVGLANNAALGKRIWVPFTSTTELAVATTPLNIAVRRGAALLPVAVIEVEPSSRFEVTIGAEITIPPSTATDPVTAMASAYAQYLLPLAKAHPDKWDWGSLSVRPT